MLVPVTEQEGLRLQSSRFELFVVFVFLEVLFIPGGGARPLTGGCCCCASSVSGGMASPSLLRNFRNPESSWEGLVERKISMLSPRFLATLLLFVLVGVDLVVEWWDGDESSG